MAKAAHMTLSATGSKKAPNAVAISHCGGRGGHLGGAAGQRGQAGTRDTWLHVCLLVPHTSRNVLRVTAVPPCALTRRAR